MTETKLSKSESLAHNFCQITTMPL